MAYTPRSLREASEGLPSLLQGHLSLVISLPSSPGTPRSPMTDAEFDKLVLPSVLSDVRSVLPSDRAEIPGLTDAVLVVKVSYLSPDKLLVWASLSDHVSPSTGVDCQEPQISIAQKASSPKQHNWYAATKLDISRRQGRITLYISVFLGYILYSSILNSVWMSRDGK